MKFRARIVAGTALSLVMAAGYALAAPQSGGRIPIEGSSHAMAPSGQTADEGLLLLAQADGAQGEIVDEEERPRRQQREGRGQGGEEGGGRQLQGEGGGEGRQERPRAEEPAPAEQAPPAAAEEPPAPEQREREAPPAQEEAPSEGGVESAPAEQPAQPPQQPPAEQPAQPPQQPPAEQPPAGEAEPPAAAEPEQPPVPAEPPAEQQPPAGGGAEAEPPASETPETPPVLEGERPAQQEPPAGEAQPSPEQPPAGEQPPAEGQPAQPPAGGAEAPAQDGQTNERPRAGERPRDGGQAQQPGQPTNELPRADGQPPESGGEAAPILDSQKEGNGAPGASGEGQPGEGQQGEGQQGEGQPGQPAGEPPADGQPEGQPGQAGNQPPAAPAGPPPESDAEAQQAVQPAEIMSVRQEEGRRLDGREERRERREGADVLREIGDRIVIQLNNQVIVESDDRGRIERDAEEVYYEELPRGRYRETVVRPNGVQVVTIRDRYGDVIQRSRIMPDGREYYLVYAGDYERDYERPRQWRDPGLDLPPLHLTIPAEEYILDAGLVEDPNVYYEFLDQPPVEQVQRLYTIDEVKYSARVRDSVRRIDLDTITFEFGSASIAESEITRLEGVATAMERLLEENPAETFLIEGHTDAVGSDEANLALSDQRAESVAAALTNVFGIPPENLVTQGYGESYLKINTEEPERENRRVAMRRITPLVAPVASAQ